MLSPEERRADDLRSSARFGAAFTGATILLTAVAITTGALITGPLNDDWSTVITFPVGAGVAAAALMGTVILIIHVMDRIADHHDARTGRSTAPAQMPVC
ncbi:hypothetical protein [Leifsonia sp. Leaf264]|uniref:hypothetical protein n=1 Tax=Leifsonia sp. Leaf264 TaxID=1736314 RepID=UPI0006F96FC2|nr:hypothetical protein [Leifsonia sp. Leaf264]KQO98383.1 hypothetical protein ASF30_10000 [Leifsonia sp. Leaf264]